MFEGLKDTLDRFKNDVEAEVDDGAAEAESETAADDAEAETPAPAGQDVAVDEGATGRPADEAVVEEPPAQPTNANSTAGADADSASEASPERNPERSGDAVEAAGAVDEADEDENETDGDAARGPSFGTKAMAFATGQAIIREEDLEDPLWDLEMALLESDVELSVAESILEGVEERLVNTRRTQVRSTGMVVEDALGEALLDVISVGQFDFDRRVLEADKPLMIVFTGVNGVGKTTTIAKLARYLEERGLSSVLANGDTYRAGANEQIEEHAKRLDKRLIAHESGGDPAAVLYDAAEYAKANDIDVVLGDTAGRLHTSNDLMAQLEKIDRVVDPDMTLFVDEAVAGQDAVQRATEFDEAAAFDGAVLAKADADSQGGAAISIAHVTGKPVLFLGTGQEYDDLERFDPEDLVDRLLSGEP